MSRLLGLEVENVKRLRAVKVKLDDGVNVVRGENEQGKSSLLDAVEYLFGGAKTHPPRVIREGETEALIVGETDDFIATRRFVKAENGHEETELEIRAKDGGGKIASPQKLMDKLYSSTAFDPVEFMNMKPDAQLDLVKRLVGVNTDEIDRSYDSLFATRTVTNTELKGVRARLQPLQAEKEPPPRASVTGLLEEQKRLNAALENVATRTAERDAAGRQVQQRKEAVKACEAAVRAAQEALAKATERLQIDENLWAAADNSVDDALETAQGATDRLAAINNEIQAASLVGAAHERWAQRLRLEKEEGELNSRAVTQTAQLAGLEQKKAQLISAAKFPIEGLSFGTSGVLFRGLPLEQASGAQQIRVSVAIAIALNPKLRVMLVREGSRLDKKSLGLLQELCQQHDAQCLVEQVGEEGPASIVIRDGSVIL